MTVAKAYALGRMDVGIIRVSGECGLWCLGIDIAKSHGDFGMTLNPTKISTDLVQWFMRAAYEEGYKAGNSDNSQSLINPKKGKWFDYWFVSNARRTLIKNNVISGKDDWR